MLSFRKLLWLYGCSNCGKLFKTGMFEEEQELVKNPATVDDEKELCLLYDDICPYCGGEAARTVWEWFGLKLFMMKKTLCSKIKPKRRENVKERNNRK